MFRGSHSTLAADLGHKCPQCGRLPAYRYTEIWPSPYPKLSALPAFYEWYCPTCNWSEHEKVFAVEASA